MDPSLRAGLNQVAIETRLVPGEIWLARKVGRDAGAAAVNLAFFDRQVDFDAAWITAHFLEFYTEGLFQDGRS